jgi:hypothetical protein
VRSQFTPVIGERNMHARPAWSGNRSSRCAAPLDCRFLTEARD